MSVDRSEFIRPVDTGLKANKEYNRFYISFKQDNKIKQKVLDFSKKVGIKELE